MMKSYALLMLFSSGSMILLAQPGVLHASEMLPPGSTYEAHSLDPLTSLDTASGAGVVWDNSHLTYSTVTQQFAVMAPSETPWPSTFPSANYSVYESALLRISYYNLNDQTHERVGSHNMDGPNFYTDPQVELTFPFQLGSSNTDTWASTGIFFPGTFSFEVIGSGTLMLSTGTFTDVLLQRVTAVNSGSTVQQYAWVSAEHGAYLLAYFPAGPFSTAGGFLTSSITVGLPEHEEPVSFRIHAPAGDQLPVTYSSPHALAYRILDAAGRVEAAGQMPPAPAPRTAMLAAGGLPAGVHLLELQGPKGRYVERFIRSH